jgi:catalase
VVPGIDFSNDRLLQGRLFSYIDTQLRRVGPNFAELPITSGSRRRAGWGSKTRVPG